MWCVIECGSEGEIFEPEFFQNEKEAMKYIVEDSKECYAMYSDLPNVLAYYDSDELEAQVWTDEFSFRWKAFDISNKLMKKESFIMKYDTQAMAEVLCKTAGVEYSSDLENLLYHLDVQAQNPYNADFRRTGLAIIAKVCEELKKR